MTAETSRAARRIGTHNGTFHCDEALACFMLRQLDTYRDAKVVRTRDEAVLKDLEVVVDVGSVYDPQALRFDHHQRGFEETFGPDWRTKLSSAGLIYKHFGRDVIGAILEGKPSAEELDMVYTQVYKSFIEEVDGIDNGINQFASDQLPRYELNTTLSKRVSRLNPPWNGPTHNEEDGFHKAMALTGSELVEVVKHTYYSWLPGKQIVRDAFLSRYSVDPSGELIVLAQYCPWQTHIYAIEDEVHTTVKYVVYEDTSCKWRVQCVNVSSGSFQSRKPLPAPWRGLRDEELSKVSGIPGCVFVHSSGFIGGNQTKDGVLAMTRAALQFKDTNDTS
eukprot:Plantae.Rhodophyta-Purpureofilum_apyrenoidigerum.ctg31194.p1 GENE.Plantae.Rhodophyta-Purpureofilum_apyrenoidigerum.ctg31194~~Plantae.Rhodophyta-Purpureofilum_apyrenoidigerum.ctg31194.p1  ORF type:complete len:374 (-),score=58.10 Plantae.Rhodophyta-Purpureofilum_apyrenoidigerum.ctg31194:65-1066(-)